MTSIILKDKLSMLPGAFRSQSNNKTEIDRKIVFSFIINTKSKTFCLCNTVLLYCAENHGRA